MSEPKPSLNMIKINKHKLPMDFFPKKELSARRSSFNRGMEVSDPVLGRKAESERMSNYTPEKTSFFGFLEEKDTTQPFLQIQGGAKLYNRKF